jgi:hypothetical protein
VLARHHGYGINFDELLELATLCCQDGGILLQNLRRASQSVTTSIPVRYSEALRAGQDHTGTEDTDPSGNDCNEIMVFHKYGYSHGHGAMVDDRFCNNRITIERKKI